MLEKTKGIILQNIKYGDTSLICHVYTENFGRKSFMFKGVRTKKSRLKSNLLQNLFVLNFEIYYKEGRDLLLVKEFSNSISFNDFPYNPVKSSQALFLSEILSKCLQEEVSNSAMFNFLISSIEYFDLHSKIANFHLAFLMKLTPFLGILPSTLNKTDQIFFDLRDGAFVDAEPVHLEYSDKNLSAILFQFYNLNYDDSLEIKLSRVQRNALLDQILKFYTIHHYKLDNLKSLEVLRELY
ncbi:MAG: DNA repair protein RecO [Bacteroidales bacterium]|nr:DNA repair protein RecO [Bacteroidales bacterium]MCF8389555.1 DNA repair protein RecO [Bacteroidales bacterium]